MNVHYFQHVPFEGPGSIKNWAQEYNINLSNTRFYAEENPPDIDNIDCLIILGGAMSVYNHDKYPWLRQEKEFIKEAIERKKVVIGICLGAQLIADVLGAKIIPNPQKEIGWFTIKKNPATRLLKIAEFLPAETLAFHWHGDTFAIPPNAVPLAHSEACQNQGFIYNDKVIAMQFHLESTKHSIEQLVKNCRHELVDAQYIQQPEELLKCDQRFVEINFIMEKCLLNLLYDHQTAAI